MVRVARMTEERSADFINSLERGLSVINSFSAERPAQTLSEVAQVTGLTRATSRRVLLTLTHLGYVRQSARQFSLTPKVLDLGYSFLSSLPVVRIAEDPMERLVARVKESSSMGVLDGTDVVYVARVPTSQIMTIPLALGARLPAHATSMGRVLLAGLTDRELRVKLKRLKLDPLTSRTITDRRVLWDALMTVRSDGYALVNQELEVGLRSIAVPIQNEEGNVIAAMNLSFRAATVSPSQIRKRYLPKLTEAAAEVSDRLRTLRIG